MRYVLKLTVTFEALDDIEARQKALEHEVALFYHANSLNPAEIQLTVGRNGTSDKCLRINQG